MASSEARPVTISSLELENVKRVRAVALEPRPTGLTVIGGRNAQGKTSVLDAICWALGGKRYEPDAPRRDGSVRDPSLRVVMSNGIVAERGGKSGTLKVTDPSGARAGQALLDSFVEQLALDLPKFMQASDKEKALALLRIIGVEDRLADLDRRESELCQRRLAVGQIERQRRGAAETMPRYPDAPTEEVDIADLAEQQREAMARNAENERRRYELSRLAADADELQREIERMGRELEARRERHAATLEMLGRLSVEADAMADADVSGIADAIESAQETNARVRANEAADAALAAAEESRAEYESLSEQIDGVRAERMGLLRSVDMPLEGLEVVDGLLAYGGHLWGDMSGAEQLMVATAIVRRLKPECGFVLVDKLEQFDTQALAEFGAWCEGEGLQVIGTRVSTGDECSVIIEDGLVAQAGGSVSAGEAGASRPAFVPNEGGAF